MSVGVHIFKNVLKPCYLVFNCHNVHVQTINYFSNPSVIIKVKMQQYLPFLVIHVAHDRLLII